MQTNPNQRHTLHTQKAKSALDTQSKTHIPSPFQPSRALHPRLIRLIFLPTLALIHKQQGGLGRKLTSSIFRLLVSSSAFPTPSSALLSAFVAPTAGRSTTVGAYRASALATPTPLPCSMTSAGMAMTAFLAKAQPDLKPQADVNTFVADPPAS